MITLASDAFFSPGSAEVKIEETRSILQKIAKYFNDPLVHDRRWRIEGHTDSTPVEEAQAMMKETGVDQVSEGVPVEDASDYNSTPVERYPSNCELSASRAANILHYLASYGVNEKQFSIVGYADTMPKFSNDTAEGRGYNRRVDIIILDEGHF